MKKKIPYYIYILCIALFVHTDIFCQGPGPGDPLPCPDGSAPPCGGPGPPPPVGLPIDGGVILLLISGVLLGVSKIQGRED